MQKPVEKWLSGRDSIVIFAYAGYGPVVQDLPVVVTPAAIGNPALFNSADVFGHDSG